MNKKKSPLYAGIIGMGGFAAAHHRAIYQLEKENLVKLLCTCDLNPENFRTQIQQLNMTERAVKIFDNYTDMLDMFRNDLHMVTVPAPIHLHAEMHRECVRRKIPVYLEKPPTLDYSELLQMIEIEKKAEKKTNVGFNYMVQPLRHDVKKRILAGEFGDIKKITFTGLWPRYPSYFKRSRWAGRLILDGKFVIDSCFGNALSHFVHNILFWCGKDGIFSWDPIETVHAELYRARQIQSTDTVFVLASTKNVRDIRIILSHACANKTRDIERLYCTKADITFEGNLNTSEGTSAECIIKWKNGIVEKMQSKNDDLVVSNIRNYIEYLSGEKKRPLTELHNCVPFVMFNGLIYIAAGNIVTIPEQYLENVNTGKEENFLSIKNIDLIAERFIEKGQFPSDQKLPWAGKVGTSVSTDIDKLPSVIRTLAGKTST